MFSLTLMSKGEKRNGLDATVGGPSSLAQPLRVSINAKGGDCWQIWQEGVCLSLMERTEGGAEGSEWRLKLRRVNE
jgi:hypothetical protein